MDLDVFVHPEQFLKFLYEMHAFIVISTFFLGLVSYENKNVRKLLIYPQISVDLHFLNTSQKVYFFY